MSTYIPGKLIYVHIPKTGGASIEYIIRGSGHFSIGYYYRRAHDFDDVFKFAFVRDPFTRFVSTLNHTRFSAEEVIEKLVRNRLTGINPELYKTQVDYLFTRDSCPMNYIGYFENIMQDYEYVAKLLMLKTPLGHQNKGKFDPNDYLYLKPAIYELYREDYEVFYPHLL